MSDKILRPEINENIEDEGYKCPYCDTLQYCDDWGYDYDCEKIYCEECGKYFLGTASHSTSFFASPDCGVNNEKHKFVHYKGDFYFCSVCHKCEILKEPQLSKQEGEK